MNMMKWLRSAGRGLSGEQKGVTLIETVVALGLLAFIAVAFLGGLWTTSKDTSTYDERATALVLVQSQIEEIKAMSYNPDGYSVTVTAPVGYTLSVSAVEPQTGKQEVTVAVNHDGRGVLKLTTTRTNMQ